MTKHNRFRTMVQEIANSDPLVLPICSKLGEPFFDDIRLMANELLRCENEIDWLKSDLYHAIQALHCSAPNELMSVEEIRAWLEIRNTLSDKYKEAT